ncbi:MAG: DUF3006 domain-containing protein [Candidatus Riflebacteria bacterium]|nr:DUF3006 domain-containing protein [Candidatus Riflebacteria bacterium]
MQGVIDQVKGKYLRCVLENGDIVKIHKSMFNKEVTEGDVIKLTFEFDEEGTKKQREMMGK